MDEEEEGVEAHQASAASSRSEGEGHAASACT